MSDVFAERQCAGADPFQVDDMLARCGRCTLTRRCQQEAADAPFQAHGVWGGLTLPKEAHLLPPPTEQKRYTEVHVHARTRTNPKGAGRPPWWADLGRNHEPAPGKHSRPLISE